MALRERTPVATDKAGFEGEGEGRIEAACSRGAVDGSSSENESERDGAHNLGPQSRPKMQRVVRETGVVPDIEEPAPPAVAEGGAKSAATGPTAGLPCRSRVTLLGDASHPMSPFKGQGANQALLDAVAFARAVRKSELFGGSVPLHEALTNYEEESLRRGATKVSCLLT